MKRFRFLLIALVPGCASWFLHGAKPASRDYARDQPGGYRVVGCKQIADGAALMPPNATYHLVNTRGSTGLFERSPNGTGSLIDNRWQDADGDHYFVWVKSTGWEFIVPKDKPPTRLVYLGMSALAGPDGAVHPTTKPAVTCDMEAL